ncbi:MAG: HAD family hydrolase [Asgard group archaeon]|nr:HAD family hydrolase [Asgard group archaeon]
MVKCISFDFDRTLSHVVPLTHFYIPKLLKEKGIEISVDEFVRSSINLRNNLPQSLVNRFAIYGTLSQAERRQFIYEYNMARIDNLNLDKEINELNEIKNWIVEKLMQNQKKLLYDDVISTIKLLKQDNYLLYIQSGNHSDGIIELLDEAGLLPLFEEIVTVDRFHPDKVENFRTILNLSKLNPKEILHIGDDLETDGKAVDYGINTVIIRRPKQLFFDDKHLLSNYKVISELSELLEYLADLSL